MIRINKFLASSGIAARRKVDELIVEGKVTVNGRKAVLGMKIDEDNDEIFVRNKKVVFKKDFVYFILNKPMGVTSTVSDAHAVKTVLDLVKTDKRIFPVGRLDVNSEGLILLTNDGELAQKIAHPRHHVPKTYEVLVSGRVSENKLEKLRNGVVLEDGRTAPAEVICKKQNINSTLLEFTIYEGKKRLIRRMVAALRLNLLNLKRIAIGNITLGNLKTGESRLLVDLEIQSLKNSL